MPSCCNTDEIRMKRRNNFREKNLPQDFAKVKLGEIKLYLNTAQTFTVIGMPSVGVSLFLKYLTAQEKAYTIYLDTYAIGDHTKHGFYVLLAEALGKKVRYAMSDQELLNASKEALAGLTKYHKKVLIIINRFELLEKEFTQQFLGSLRLLSHGLGKSISLIFALTRPFEEVSLEALGGGNSDMFSRYYYFKTYREKDMQYLLA